MQGASPLGGLEVVLATPDLRHAMGGPAYSVRSIGRYLSQRGALASFLVARTEADTQPRAGLSRLAKADVIHNFGMWSPFNHLVSRFAGLAGRTVVACPMGMLEPWAMAQKARKKRLAWRLYQRQDLRRAAAVHATAPSEAEHLRALGVTSPIAVIPHGVEAPEVLPARQRRAPDSLKTLLFLSRINAKKGLLDMVEAWARLRPVGWRAWIAGPDEDGHQSQVESLIRDRGLAASFTFLGPLYGEQKRKALLDADLFILPTYSENFGHVVPEALVHGLPVITTTGAPWRELLESRSGYWVEPGIDGITPALEAAFQLSDDERHAMGQRGRSWVMARYSWSAAAAKYLELYAWLLGRGPRPSFVLT